MVMLHRGRHAVGVLVAVAAALLALGASSPAASAKPRGRTKAHRTVRCHVVRRGHRRVKVCPPARRKPRGHKPRPAPARPRPAQPAPSAPTSSAPTPGAPAPSAPSDGKVIFDSGGNLYQVNGLGQGRTALTTDGSPSGYTQYIEPSLSQDGSKLVFQGPNSQVFVADPSAVVATMKQLTGPSDDLPGMYPRISPDGSQATWTELFLLEYGGQLTNYVQNTDGSNLNWYYTTGGIDGFGPNGTILCNNSNVYNQLIVGTPAQAPNNCAQIVADQSSDQNARFGTRPAFSPDGQLVADSYNDYPSETMNGIYLYNATTGQLIRQLTNVPGDDYPVFSPDGSEILFNRGSDIYEVPTAGGPATLFVSGGSNPTWSR